MRKILLLLTAFSSLVCLAQENNPYNAKGLQYLASLKLIKDDFAAGKVKDFTEESLQYYSNVVPLKNQVTIDVATDVIQTLKDKNADFNSIVSESSLSPASKQVYKEFYEASVRLGAAGFREHVRKKVEVIKKSRMGEGERESLLSLAAILYHGVEARRGCVTTISTSDGVMVDDSGTGCVVLGMTIGYLAGNLICGTLCGIGGAIVGGVIGALT